jgi:hypothetical protein
MVLVAPGGDPIDRRQWAFRPELASVTVGAPARGDGAMAWPQAGVVIAVALVTCALVLLVPWRTAGPRSSSQDASLV